MDQSQSQSAKNDSPLEVLFVDDEKLVLDGIRRQFRAQKNDWNMRFASSGTEALEMLEVQHADVVVSDMRMPGMSGATLLNQVRERWPETVRFILSGQTDQSELLQDIGCIHQYLQKPCDPQQLIQAINRTHSLIASVKSSKILCFTTGIQSLPIVSQVYLRLVDELNSDESNADTVSRIVQEDVGLSVKILQLVNSAFYGMPRQTVAVKDAIVLIGMKNLLDLVMSAQIFDTLSQAIETQEIVSKLWAKSSDIGALAKSSAKSAGLSQNMCDTACLAGVLSHIGRAILARTMPYEFSEMIKIAEEDGRPLRELEMEIFGIPQESVGAYALGIWGFSDQIVETVAMQESPSLSIVKDTNHPLAWVHLGRAQNRKSQYIDGITLQSSWLTRLGIDANSLVENRSAA